MKNYWRVYFVMSAIVNLAVIANYLDRYFDYMTWGQYDVLSIVAGFAVNAGCVMLLGFPVAYGIEKLIDNIIIRRVDRENVDRLIGFMR